MLSNVLVMDKGNTEDRGSEEGGAEKEAPVRSREVLEARMCGNRGNLRLCLYLINEWH